MFNSNIRFNELKFPVRVSILENFLTTLVFKNNVPFEFSLKSLLLLAYIMFKSNKFLKKLKNQNSLNIEQINSCEILFTRKITYEIRSTVT